MLGKYRFKKVYDLKSFQRGEDTPNSISFPINNSAEFPALQRYFMQQLEKALFVE